MKDDSLDKLDTRRRNQKEPGKIGLGKNLIKKDL